VNPYATLVFLSLLVTVQTALVPYAALGPAKPLLPLLAVVAWGLLRGPRAAVWWALILGILLDAVSDAPPGFYTLPLLVGAGVTVIARGRMATGNILLPGAIIAVATVAFTLVQRALLTLIVMRAGAAPPLEWTWTALGEDIVPVVALNMLWLPLLYFPLRFVATRTAPRRMEWER
jgi:rod shape-determining protein MreD